MRLGDRAIVSARKPGVVPSATTAPPTRRKRAATEAAFITVRLIPATAESAQPDGALLDRLADILADALIADLKRHPRPPPEGS